MAPSCFDFEYEGTILLGINSMSICAVVHAARAELDYTSPNNTLGMPSCGHHDFCWALSAVCKLQCMP